MATKGEVDAALKAWAAEWCADDHEPNDFTAMRAALEAAEYVRQADLFKNCRHPRKSGSGSVSSDGSSHSTWFCPDCGAHGESRTPPREDGEGMRAMLGSLPR